MKIFYRRYIAILALLGIVISTLFYLRLDRLQQSAVIMQFQEDIERNGDLFEREFASSLATVRFGKALYEASDAISANQFRRFSRSLLEHSPGLVELAWTPLVVAVDRSAIEQQRQLQIADFHFMEYSDSGRLVKAKQRSEYYPVYYAQSRGKTEANLGFDFSSDETLRRVLARARLSGQMAVTLILPGSASNDLGVELRAFEPVYRGDPGSDVERFGNLRGFVVGRFSVREIITRALDDSNLGDISLQLIDVTDASPAVLFDTSTSIKERSLMLNSSYQKPLADIGGRRWVLAATPTKKYMATRKSAMAEMVFLFGVILTLVVSLYIFIVSKREGKIQEIVSQRTKELSAANQKLELMTLTDALTGVVNRRGFDQVLEIEWNRSIREAIPITLLIIDVDCFKYYNDNYGHIAGDDCLKRVAEAIADVPQRLGDLVARYGGEEFAVMLPNTDDRDTVVADKCRFAVEALAIEHGYSLVSRYVTVSIGAATLWPQRGSNCVSLIQAADEAMYIAKTEGRNRVVKALAETA